MQVRITTENQRPLKHSADANFRSIQGEINAILSAHFRAQQEIEVKRIKHQHQKAAQ